MIITIESISTVGNILMISKSHTRSGIYIFKMNLIIFHKIFKLLLLTVYNVHIQNVVQKDLTICDLFAHIWQQTEPDMQNFPDPKIWK